MSEFVVTKPLGERIASLETRQDIYEENQREILEKLDQLIALKDKGAGAFLLVSALFGTSILAAFYYVVGPLIGLFQRH